MERKLTEFNQPVVRSLVVSLAPPGEIYHSYQEGGNPSILRFYLGIKDEGAHQRYTLLGGKLEVSENWKEAIQREITEEAGLKPFGIPYQTKIGSWQYSSPRSGDRRVMLTYNPVLPCGQITIGDPKIKDVVTISLEELQKLIREGQLNGIPIEGHLALGESAKDQVDISPENAQRKDVSLLKALRWMEKIEEYLKKRFEQVLFSEEGIVSEDEFKAEYEKILSNYMRKGFEVAVKQKEEANFEKRHSLIEALDGGYLGKDILYYLPELAEHGVNWPGLENATDGVKVFFGFLKQTFDEYLKTQGLSDEDYRLKMADSNVTLEEKISRLNALDQFFKRRLKEIFNVDDGDLDEVSEYIRNFFRDLSNEMKVADPKLTTGLYQDFTLVNEVNNANFGYLLSLFLGFDTKENKDEANRLIRFEAGRQLTLLLKGLAGIKHYQDEVSQVQNGRLQSAVNNFFGPFLAGEIISLGENQKMRVRIRQINNQFVIVDEKPIKSFTSFLRKSFEERVHDISDFHTISITFRDQNENNIKNCDLLIDQFEQFLKENFPNSQLRIKDKRDYGTKDYINHQEEEVKVGGKRKGSQGNKFVRTKIIFQLDKEKLELIIYPFYSIPDENGNFWGWLETRIDDKDYVVRRLLAGENGTPSLYDLLFPPDLYPHHFQHKLNTKYHK